MTYSSSPSELVSFGGRDFCYTCNLSLLTLSRIGLVDGWTDWLVICREKAGVTQDLSTDPTLVSLATLSSEIGSSAHTSNLTSLIARLIALHVIITSMFEVFSFFLTQRQHCKPFTHGVFTYFSPHSAVFYQDQSKRTETRMILFYVCTKCGTNFTDPEVNKKGAELDEGPGE